MLSFPLNGWLTQLFDTHTHWPGIAWPVAPGRR
jgi:hypothetical protein